MSRKNAEILLGSVIFARSTSLLFAKIGLASISPLNLLAVRFCLAFLVLSVIFRKKLRQTTKTDVLHGLISREAPMGKMLLGKKVGDRFYVQVNDNYGYWAVVRAIEKGSDDGSAELNSF